MPQTELQSLTRWPSEMLSLSNLAKHTEHHIHLDEGRDFVKEFLESLDSTSMPEHDPEPAVAEPIDTNQDNLDHSRQQQQSHKSKRKRKSQDSPEVPRPSINNVTVSTVPRTRHGDSSAVIDGTGYRDNPRPTAHDDPKNAKKQRQILDLELEIQQLDINQPRKTSTSARECPGGRSTRPTTGKKLCIAIDGVPGTKLAVNITMTKTW